MQNRSDILKDYQHKKPRIVIVTMRGFLFEKKKKKDASTFGPLRETWKRRKSKEKKVVIPIQTISFYNKTARRSHSALACCHTYPNDKLLQPTDGVAVAMEAKLSYLSKR